MQLDPEKSFVISKIIADSDEEKYISSAYKKRREQRITNREQDIEMQKNYL